MMSTPTDIVPGRGLPGAAPPASLPVLRAERLCVRRGGREVLRSVSVEIGAGWTALVGPNGAGKSTLLRALAGLQAPAAGHVWLRTEVATRKRGHGPDHPLDNRLDHALDHALGPGPAPATERSHERDLRTLRPAERARHLAWLAQQGDSSGELTVRETVELGRIARLGLVGVPGPDDRAAVDTAMALTESLAWQHRPLQQLSGGERQRVLVARVLATEAPMLLLDEPTTHLDAPHQVALARLLRRLSRHDAGGGRAVLSVLHDLPIALQADRLLVLADGQLKADGPPGDRTVQAALVQVFGGAIRIEAGAEGTPQVVLSLDAPPTHP